MNMQCCAQCRRWTEAEVDEYKLRIGVCAWSNRMTCGTDICALFDGDHSLPTNRTGRVLMVEDENA